MLMTAYEFRIGDLIPYFALPLLFLFVSVTAGDRLCHAARGMALENFALCAAKSGLDCLDLVQDVDAVTIVLDHLGYTTHLSFDPAKTIDDEIGRAHV